MKTSFTRRELFSTLGVAGATVGLVGCGTGGGTRTLVPVGTPTPSGATPTPGVTPTPGPTPTPTPSPTGTRTERFGFVEVELGKSYIGSVRADGSDYRRVPIQGQPNITALDWSLDGKRIAFQVDQEPDGVIAKAFIYTVNADGSNLRFFQRGLYPKWHPDGKRLACVITSAGAANGQPGIRLFSYVYGEYVETGEGAVLAPSSPSFIPMFNGEVTDLTVQYVRPQWLTTTDRDLLASLFVSGPSGNKSRIEQYSLGAELFSGQLSNTDATGEVYSLGVVAPDGTYTFTKTTIGPSSFDRETRAFIVRNGVLKQQDPSFGESGLRLFSPDSTRCLVSNGFQLAMVPVGGTDRTPVSTPMNVAAWFYEA